MMVPSSTGDRGRDLEPAAALGDLLRLHRRAAGLSQEELAQRSGLSPRTLSDIERGRTARPFGRSVRLVADALELDDAGRACLLHAANGGATSARDVAPVVVPRQLPAAVRRFVCREDELCALDDLLAQARADDGAVGVVAICGTAGVGKTALAVHWAHRMAAQFPDGQLYVDLRGYDRVSRPVRPAAAIRGFLEALGVPAERLPAGLSAQVSLYRSLVAGRRMLVVLDNARNPAQVRPLLPGAGCFVVVTSRAQLTGLAAAENASLLSLELFTEAAARQFLVVRLGPDLVRSAPAAVSELIRQCASLPLALSIVAARAASSRMLPLEALAAELADASLRLDALECGDPALSMRAVLSWSYRGLPAGAAHMFRLLGIHPGSDISVPAAASLASTGHLQAGRYLRELVAASMLTQPVPGRYMFHDLLRSYARECLAESTDGCAEPH
jgi:transcriptional regulator with XRE-family HTH domain